MANFAPPICRDGFVYHGQLFADVGNLNRHPRASIQDLNDLLRPSKPAKDGQSKDQVGHWYFAQLRHYGLPPTKDKNAAKVRLLNALNGGQLKVPSDVKKLESQLKRDYDAANKKAKAEMKGGGSTPVTQTTTAKPTANKRKRDDDEAVATKAPAKKKTAATPVTSTINVGRNGDINVSIAYQGFMGNVGDAGNQGAPKKAAAKKTSATAKSTTVAKNTTTAKKATTDKTTTTAKTKTTAKSTTISKGTTSKAATSKATPVTAQKKTTAKSTAKSTASGSTKSTGAAGSAKKPAEKSSTAPKRNAVPKDKGLSSAKTKGATKKTANSASGPATQNRIPGVIKQENDFFNSSGPATPFDHGISQFFSHDPRLDNITGFYDVQCTVEEDFPAFCENGCRMMLCRERDSGRIWGSFSFGFFFGIIQSNPGPTSFSRHPLSLGWRAKNLETGQLQFGRGCTGDIVFEDAKNISGRILGLYENVVEFYGRRRDGPANCGYVPSEFESEWASYPATAYGREESSHEDLSNGGFSGDDLSHNGYSNDGCSNDGCSNDGYSNDGDLNEGYSDDENAHDGHSNESFSENDVPGGTLYDDDGHLRPTGRFENLMRESLWGW